MTDLPARPDFEAIDAVAASTADSRTRVLALIGNLVFAWSNNESMFVHVLQILLEGDEVTAALVFGTLNTTRARLELIERLAAAKLQEGEAERALHAAIDEFGALTRIRNEFNHCTYGINARGEIAQTYAMRITETKGKLRLGTARAMDEARLQEMTDAVARLKKLNRDLWDLLPVLKAAVEATAAIRARAARRASRPALARDLEPAATTRRAPASSAVDGDR